MDNLSHENTEGKEVLIDLWGVDFDVLNSLEYIGATIKIAIQKCGATLVSTLHKKFNPSGVTILGLLEESHIGIHTYPSRGFAALSIYVCGSADPEIAVDYIVEALKPNEVNRQSIIRGVK